MEYSKFEEVLNNIKEYLFTHYSFNYNTSDSEEKYDSMITQISSNYDVLVFNIIGELEELDFNKKEMLRSILDNKKTKCIFIVTHPGARCSQPAMQSQAFCEAINSEKKTYEKSKDFFWYCTSDVTEAKDKMADEISKFLNHSYEVKTLLLQLSENGEQEFDDHNKLLQSVKLETLKKPISLQNITEDIKHVYDVVKNVGCVIIAASYQTLKHLLTKQTDGLHLTPEVTGYLKTTVDQIGDLKLKCVFLISDDPHTIIGEECSSALHDEIINLINELTGYTEQWLVHSFKLVSWKEEVTEQHKMCLKYFMENEPSNLTKTQRECALSTRDTDTARANQLQNDEEIANKKARTKKNVPVPKLERESPLNDKTELKVLVVNFDCTVTLSCVNELLEGVKLSCEQLEFKTTRIEASISIMKQGAEKLNDQAGKGDFYDFAIFAVHAHESRLNINEPSAGIGYYIFYQALKLVTNDHVVVVFAGDSSNEDKALSVWVHAKVSTQFTPEYVNGEKGLLISWDNSPQKCHFKALKRFIRRLDVLIFDPCNAKWAADDLLCDSLHSIHWRFATGRFEFGSNDNQEGSCIEKLVRFLQEKCDLIVLHLDAQCLENEENLQWKNFQYLVPLLINPMERRGSLVLVVTSDHAEAKCGDVASNKVIERLTTLKLIPTLINSERCLLMSWKETFRDVHKAALHKWLFSSKLASCIPETNSIKPKKLPDVKIGNETRHIMDSAKSNAAAACTDSESANLYREPIQKPNTKRAKTDGSELHCENQSKSDWAENVMTMLQKYAEKLDTQSKRTAYFSAKSKWHVLGARYYDATGQKSFTEGCISLHNTYKQDAADDAMALHWIGKQKRISGGKNSKHQFWIVYLKNEKDQYNFDILKEEIKKEDKH